MSTPSIHTGLHARRLADTGPSSLREKAFAEQWEKEQDDDLLAFLLGSDNHRGNLSERDAQVAATVIQWLGTNVGQNFLEKVSIAVAQQQSRTSTI